MRRARARGRGLAALLGLVAPGCGDDGDGAADLAQAESTTAATDQDDGIDEGESGSTGEHVPQRETTGSVPALCEPRDPVTPRADFFRDVSEQSGIRLDNFAEEPREGTAINDHSRLAFADLDGDGYDDIVMHSLFPNAQNGVPFEHLVFRNDGSGRFEPFSDESGLRDAQVAFFAFADVDNDGDQDAFGGLDLPDYAAGSGSGIWLNDGQGRMTRLADAGVEGAVPAANASFGDFDGDGVLDLFVGMGGTTFASPDRLYAGRGDGTFANQTAALSGPPRAQPSNGSVTCDYDGDGDLDILVSTYSVSTAYGLNHLWDNDGSGVFTDVAVGRGFASQPTGNYWLEQTGHGTSVEAGARPGTFRGSNGFGIDCGDVDGDGRLDVLLTAISHPVNSDLNRKWSDPSQLLWNAGPDDEAGYFHNQWLARGLPFNEGDIDGALVDFDNDGRLDISISRERKYEGSYSGQAQKSWFGLMRQRGSGAFDDLGVVSGINDPAEALLRMKGAQNHAWSDVDHDGDLDLLVGGRDQGGGRPNFLFENTLGQDNRWLAVRLVGDGESVNRAAIGARVTLSHDDGQIVRTLKSARGTYNSEDTRVLHFGLGSTGCARTLEVVWPDGTRAAFDADVLDDDRYVTIAYPGELQ